MIKKFVVILLFFIFYLAYAIPSFAETPFTNVNKEVEEIERMPEKLEDDLNCTKDIQYTEEQKKRLDQIYHRIYKDYHDLIETYAWAGALTDEQKNVRHSMLKNYILTFAKRNYKWCSEWEEDEWEEEWYNIDRD
ncbi:hypothetical protein BABA_14602 [Neobacillus bataviensis LMG 21833]|uniref:DUF2680 domain-containing protein n=1 Tax=Neobacillus bataviensis LMG 21833 TaxID=1117379 RepID=K6E0K9_9BACI|nr:hypothetical protein [Neobacillus bataviensis]EKN66696.1 hypothetical protein BABA_14602 [Neobacillus bataviensis LMG 21833]